MCHEQTPDGFQCPAPPVHGVRPSRQYWPFAYCCEVTETSPLGPLRLSKKSQSCTPVRKSKQGHLCGSLCFCLQYKTPTVGILVVHAMLCISTFLCLLLRKGEICGSFVMT